MLFEGINDITWTALPAAPDAERTTPDEPIETLAKIVDRAHAHGITVMGGTRTVAAQRRDGGHASQTVNARIRTSGKFDAVADFASATRDPREPARLRREFDSGDHIHPNGAGNAAMADAIDTALFAR